MTLNLHQSLGGEPAPAGVLALGPNAWLLLRAEDGPDRWLLEGRSAGPLEERLRRYWHALAIEAARQLDPAVEAPQPSVVADPEVPATGRAERSQRKRLSRLRRRLVGLP